jgi:hypothetical protein
VKNVMAKNRMQDLRDHLFETLESLKDEEKPMAIERAEAIAKVAEQIIGTAKVTVQYLEVIGQVDEIGAEEFFKERALPGTSVKKIK